MSEILKKAPKGYEGSYIATTDGDIFKILKSGSQKKVNPRQLDKTITIRLSKDKKQRSFSLPKLIFETFARKDRYENPDGSFKKLIYGHKDGNIKNNAFDNISIFWADEPIKKSAYNYVSNDFQLEKFKKNMTEKQKASITLLKSWSPGQDRNKWRWLKVETDESKKPVYTSKSNVAGEASQQIQDWVKNTKYVTFLEDKTNEKEYIRFKKIVDFEVFERKYPIGEHGLTIF